MLDFPASPALNQPFGNYKWNGYAWAPQSTGGGGGVPEAPATGQDYARNNSDWLVLEWSSLDNKPATFPPSSHGHPIADVSGLQSALDARELTANKGLANGYASLDAGAKVPAAQLPSYVDDVVEYPSLAAFPATGTAGLIYVALDTNKTYRWGGSAYTEISPSPGSTDAVPEGATNLYFTNERVDDRVAALLVAGANITLTYNDASNTLTIDGAAPAIIDGGTF